MTLLLFVFCATAGKTQAKQFDQALANSLGADDYGMKMYTLVLLKTGTNTGETKTVTDSIFRGHLANIRRLASIGKLIVAGPLAKNEKMYEGIFILNVATIEAAQDLLGTDPAVKAHLLEAEIYPWYGAAALPMYLRVQDKVEKKSF